MFSIGLPYVEMKVQHYQKQELEKFKKQWRVHVYCIATTNTATTTTTTSNNINYKKQNANM